MSLSKNAVPMSLQFAFGALAFGLAAISGAMAFDQAPSAYHPVDLLAPLPDAAALNQALPAYQAVENLSGHINTVGSDTLNKLMKRWTKDFMAFYPGVEIDIEARGSATAPPALLDGAAQFGPMSRPMTTKELAVFEQKYGYGVSHVTVAVDALAVYVNKDNPITCLTVRQLNGIFSSTRWAEFGPNIDTWGDVGLTGDWATQPIALYGRNALSGTHEFFRDMVLLGGDYKAGVTEQIGSEAVVQAVASNKFAIGYSGIGYKTYGVRTVPLAWSAGDTCYDTSARATYSGKYPLVRYLYVYLNKNPNQPLDTLSAEFIKYVVSKDGQAQTEAGGFYRITAKDRESGLKNLGIAPHLQ